MGLSKKTIVYFYIIFLFLGSVIPIGNGTSDILMDNYTLDIRWDYLLHAMVYLPLPIIMFYGLKQMRKGAMIWIVFVSLTLPALFEVAQMLVPYRNFNINDLMANGFGVTLGWVVVLLFSLRLSSSGTK